MAFIQRNESGVICGVYRNPQEGYAEEELADDDPAVVAYTVLPARRAAKLAALATWRDAWAQDVTRGETTYTLRANDDAQGNFTRYVVALTQQITAGVTQPTDTLPLQDAAGAVHYLAVSEILAALAVYSRAVMLRELQLNATMAAIGAAQTVAELDAITWG